MIKSNAYGHGAAQFASLLPSAEWFGVNSLEEGLELRRLGTTRPVLLGKSGEERISAETMAEWAGTINYEVVTRISPFLPRKIVG